MKSILVLALAFFSISSFANIKCVGKTVEAYTDGTTDHVRTKLRKVIDDRAQAVYYGESHLFKFWVLHELKDNLVTLEIMNLRDGLVVHSPRMKLAKFSVAAGGYWQDDFSHLECSTSKNVEPPILGGPTDIVN